MTLGRRARSWSEVENTSVAIRIIRDLQDVYEGPSKPTSVEKEQKLYYVVKYSYSMVINESTDRRAASHQNQIAMGSEKGTHVLRHPDFLLMNDGRLGCASNEMRPKAIQPRCQDSGRGMVLVGVLNGQVLASLGVEADPESAMHMATAWPASRRAASGQAPLH
ncbi:hypothetical protein CPLU01_00038 [Colletotrichum plurivorum]|uniref:Uncharacterized protein n=1 Tax=Colletotrichum plurivorum TaxID=2175906 RepID=A0A8H6NSU2_9PEZI|nr:hypothetical protein CPLU01_00038 [Colletotrichum plurivorum]